MRRGHRLSLSLVIVFSLICSGWMYLATVPLGLGVSDLTLRLLDDVFDLVQSPNSTPPQGELAAEDVPLVSATTSNHTSQDSGRLSPAKSSMNSFLTQVYVISLPHRTDRRLGMERVHQVVSLNWTYVDAFAAKDPIVDRIVEQVASRRARQALNFNIPQSFSWPADWSSDHSISLEPLDQGFAEEPRFTPDRNVLIPRVQSKNPEHFDLPLTCAIGNRTSGTAYDDNLPPYMILTPPKIACWHSHLQVLRRIAEGGGNLDLDSDSVSLILEDDIDMERDFHQRLARVQSTLPTTWDMLFLGHCWSNESFHPAVESWLNDDHVAGHTSALHPSRAPKCTHAYAVTRHGARRLLMHLSYPPFAYSRALDQAYSWLILTGRLESYSIVPSIVVQRKVASSDVDAGGRGVGSEWKEILVDGVF